jgi:hypothetical protein
MERIAEAARPLMEEVYKHGGVKEVKVHDRVAGNVQV